MGEEEDMGMEDVKKILEPKTLIKILTILLLVMMVFLGYTWGFRDAYDGLKAEHEEHISRYCSCRDELVWDMSFKQPSNNSLENK